jgi:hypothetical protein
MTEFISYQEGVNLTLNWDYTKLLCVAFIENNCDACDSFKTLMVPELEQMGVDVKIIDMDKNIIPFPPNNTPTTFWYIKENLPPMQKKGIPPNKFTMIDQVEKMIKVNRGELNVEEAFM